MTAERAVDLHTFSDLVPIKALTPDHIQELAQKSQLGTLEQGKFLFKLGEEADRIVYLLKGEVELITAQGGRRNITGGTKLAKLSLEQSKVHQLSAVAKSEIEFLKVDPNLLDIMLTWEQAGGYEVQELASEGHEASDDDWMARILQAKVFHRIPPANIQSIFMKMEAQHFKAGEYVINQGDDGEHFFIVREGICDVVRKTRKNPEGVRLARLSVGDNFGEEALISGGKRNASVIMVKDDVLMSLSKKDFLSLMNEPLLNWVDYRAAKNITQQSGVWVDVRLPTEYQGRHFLNSINIPLPILRAKIDKLDKNIPYVVYCDTGRRSSTATYLMSQNGFDASVLKGGLQQIDPDELVTD